MSLIVLDASVLMAIILQEPIDPKVAVLLEEEKLVSTVNYSETLAKTCLRGVDADFTIKKISSLQLSIVPFTENHASLAAKMITITRAKGLSFADRACLALAKAQQIPALTADTAWKDLDVGVDIVLVR